MTIRSFLTLLEFMTVRLFVTSAGALIFTWLATTYFRAVPMDSYLRSAAPTVSVAGAEPEVAATLMEGPLRVETALER